MIRAVTDLRTGERVTYSYKRIGRVRGKIVSNDTIDLNRYLVWAIEQCLRRVDEYYEEEYNVR